MTSGPVGPLKSWVDRIVEAAVGLVAAALLLNWAWILIRPLVPVLVTIVVGVAVTAAIVRRHHGW